MARGGDGERLNQLIQERPHVLDLTPNYKGATPRQVSTSQRLGEEPGVPSKVSRYHSLAFGTSPRTVGATLPSSLATLAKGG